MPEYNYDGYAQSLERTLEAAQKDFWSQYIDINRHQVIVGRTYLWVSAALLAAYTASYQQFQDVIHQAPLPVIALCLAALIFAVVAFGICLYAIPARYGYKMVHEQGWGELSSTAYKLLKEKKAHLYSLFLTDLIHKFDVACVYNSRTNSHRAKLLRFTSWLLIISFALALIAAVGLALGNVPDLAKEAEHMTESTDTSSSGSDAPSGSADTPSTPQAPTAQDLPDVPEPPPPAGSGGSGISTHSEGPGDNVIFTEGQEPPPFKK